MYVGEKRAISHLVLTTLHRILGIMSGSSQTLPSKKNLKIRKIETRLLSLGGKHMSTQQQDGFGGGSFRTNSFFKLSMDLALDHSIQILVFFKLGMYLALDYSIQILVFFKLSVALALDHSIQILLFFKLSRSIRNADTEVII
ncbi:hypothetical protein AVEN_15558-1 [Araneus ventricosus]|uniref:Uncharacterized protein n=1 Tax=Araneus ventricosus TaxID=182803 RepID=A0A4Y2FRV0_ARAVE|nr:hypothetical protein AVEN_15558-1 [Araneus ventricosus]